MTREPQATITRCDVGTNGYVGLTDREGRGCTHRFCSFGTALLTLLGLVWRSFPDVEIAWHD